MSINQPPASALDSPTEGLKAQEASSPGVAPSIERLKVAAAKIHTTIGWSGVAALSTGAILALACTIWAILEGVAPPLAIMVGYCALVGSACLCTALLVIQNLATKVSPVVAKRQPNYAAWKLVSKLSITDASRLWCDIEPGCPGSQESIAWGMAMIDAVKRGELVISPRDGTRVAGQSAGSQEQNNPTWHTQIARDALKSWAKAHGHSPQFLQP
jgi:hypothetical protein